MHFDIKLFAQLLEKAKGNRSINKYASDVDVSPAHISRLLRGLLVTPPSPETIKKLAMGAYNEVNYNDLMRAAGHINTSDEIVDEENRTKNNRAFALEKRLFQILVSELYSYDFEWSINKPSGEFPDLIIDINNGEYSKWYIEFRSGIEARSVFNIYGHISILEFEPDSKFTIVVHSEANYTFLQKQPPKSLTVNLFVMLVDLDAGKIIKEERLCQYPA